MQNDTTKRGGLERKSLMEEEEEGV